MLRKSHAVVFCAFLLITGLLVSFFYLSSFSFSLIALTYIIFFAYSARPFRLKEKRFVGVATHGMFTPLLIVAAYSSLDIKVLIFSVSVFILSVMAGLTQEIRDIDADKRAGFKTTGVSLGYENGLRLLKFLIISSVAIFSFGIILYMPLYMILIVSGSFFYIKFLFKNPKPEKIFTETINAWKKGIIVVFIVAIILVPFYMKWVVI